MIKKNSNGKLKRIKKKPKIRDEEPQYNPSQLLVQ